MRVFVSILFGIVFISLVGCASSQYLVDKPLMIYPQNVLNAEGDAVQKRAMQALLDSFSRYNWEIHGIDKVNGTVTAEACRRGQHCAEVLATVNQDGSVEVIRTPGQRLSKDEGILLQRWLGSVTKLYKKYMSKHL